MTLMNKFAPLCGRSVFFVLVSLWLAYAPTASAQVFSLEEPPFETLKKVANFELRSYRPMVIAEVTVQGDVTTAGKEGSRLVKEYIFRQGVNQPTAAGKQADEKISMTVPVTMEKAPEKIAMTVPVTMEKTPEKISMTVPVTMESNAEAGYRLHFVMPSKHTMQTLPKPADPRVTLREIPARKVAAVRFSKFSTEATIAAQTALLRTWMAEQGLKAAGNPQFARYDPPFVPPMLRRSEILISVE